MPLNLHVTVGDNTFDAGGDLVFDEAFKAVFVAWLDVVLGCEDGDRFVEQLEEQTEALQAAVTAATPTP